MCVRLVDRKKHSTCFNSQTSQRVRVVEAFQRSSTNEREMDPGFRMRKRKERLYDKMHKGAVNVCMGITAIAGLFLGYKVYEYFRYVRPLHLAQTKLAQDELLLEGKNIEDSPNIELSS